jgi:thiol-disulfide isomerase/thioredoxin
MKKTILFSVMGLLCFFLPAKAQFHPTEKALKQGEKVPDYIWQNSVNLMDLSGHITRKPFDSFHNKIIILEFWGTWCISCLNAIPNLHLLQEKYKDRVSFILVNSTKSTRDTEAKIIKSVQRQNGQIPGGFTLPSIVGDSLLDEAFPHTSIPHLVWIGTDGIVKAITSHEEVTSHNIDLLITENAVKTYGKVDQATDKLIYSNKDLPEGNLEHYSILLKGRVDGIGGSRQRVINGAVRGIVACNRSLFTLYEMAAIKLIPGFSPKNIVLDVPDTTVFLPPASPELQVDWRRKNDYSLDLVVPAESFSDFYKIMLADLNIYSGYTGKIIKRDMASWVITRTSSNDLLSTKGGEYNNTLFESNQQVLNNAGVRDLVDWLEGLTGNNEAVIDETGLKMIDIKFDKLITNIETAKSELLKRGLNLSRQTKTLDILLISKTNPNPH